MAILTQILLLVWKNWKLKKRHLVATVIRIVLPAGLMLLMVMFRSFIHPDIVSTVTITPSFEIKRELPWTLILPPRESGTAARKRETQSLRWTLVYAPDGPVATRLGNSMAKMLNMTPVGKLL